MYPEWDRVFSESLTTADRSDLEGNVESGILHHHSMTRSSVGHSYHSQHDVRDRGRSAIPVATAAGASSRPSAADTYRETMAKIEAIRTSRARSNDASKLQRSSRNAHTLPAQPQQHQYAPGEAASTTATATSSPSLHRTAPADLSSRLRAMEAGSPSASPETTRSLARAMSAAGIGGASRLHESPASQGSQGKKKSYSQESPPTQSFAAEARHDLSGYQRR